MKKIAILLFAVLFVESSYAQSQNRHSILVPDIQDFISLKCDFHMHTVFSDGSVWPDVRVEEAFLEGLDAIAITDHIEYLPHKKDVSTDHNRPYEIAKFAADAAGILLIQGTEITRGMPPGHLNALFISDANPIDTANYLDALSVAKEQGAFIFWNHPGWLPQAREGIKWYDEHSRLLEAGIINGIEIVNYNEWYPEAFKWCVEKNLTMMSNSDIHESLSSFNEKNEQELRPMTLVFAQEKSPEGIKEALFGGRTVAWFKGKVIGKEVYVRSLAEESLFLEETHFKNNNTEFRKLINKSDFHFYMERNGEEFHLKPRGEMIVTGSVDHPDYEFKITNFITENGELNIIL
ncbi:MAG: PHP domain-containing protein [Bacteroidales bacterium]|nr:PHP domain-containing protein [Bacteroidales bacterium]